MKGTKKILFILGSWALLGAATVYVGLQTVLPHEMGDEAARQKINHNFSLLYNGGPIDHSDSTATFNYIDFMLSDGWTFEEGRVGWDTVAKTLSIALDAGSILQTGQEIHVRATNKTGSTITNGQCVYVDGAQGNRPTIALSDNDSPLAFNTIGLATQDIDNNRTGYVTMIGLVRGLNTSAWSEGEVLWVDSIAGGLTNVRPDAPQNAVVVGLVVYSHASEGIIGTRVTTVPRLAWLSDVASRGTQQGDDILVWNSDSLYWEARDSLALDGILYKNTFWDDLRVPLTNTRINPANTEPDFEDRGDGMYAWGFDPDSDSTWVLNFTAQTPHKRKDSTLIEAHIHWQPDGTNTGDVVWKLIYTIANVDGTFTSPDTLRVVDAADGVTLKHQLVDFGALLGSDTMRISAAIVGSVARMGDAADDTYTGTAYGIEIDFHYEIDSPGSREEYIK